MSKSAVPRRRTIPICPLPISPMLVSPARRRPARGQILVVANLGAEIEPVDVRGQASSGLEHPRPVRAVDDMRLGMGGNDRTAEVNRRVEGYARFPVRSAQGRPRK